MFPSNFVQVVEELEPSVKTEHIPGIDFFLLSNQAPLNKMFVYPNSTHECWTFFFFSSPDPKGRVSYCYHWASVVCRPSSVRPLTFHILINSSEATGSIWTKLWWNGPWMAPFQNCVRWSRLPTKMAAKLKIEKRGDEILIVDCCFSISQNELQF
jgi:hypothetical protein